MQRFDERAELVPHDVVARAIDFVMKRLVGINHVYLYIIHQPAKFIQEVFPNIYNSPSCTLHLYRVWWWIKQDELIFPIYDTALGEPSCNGLHCANLIA